MMKTYVASVLHLFIWVALGLTITGFTGREVYVELEGFINGRESARFRSSDQNVRAVLPRGTKGQILEYTEFSSGNYGLKIRTLNGQRAGEEFWVYYRPSAPHMRLFEAFPQQWRSGSQTQGQAGSGARPTTQVERATAAETTRPVTAFVEPAPRGASGPRASHPEAMEALIAGQTATQAVQAAGTAQAVAPSSCRDCVSGSPARIAPPSSSRARMAPMCSNFIGSDGSYGQWGRQLAAIVSEPRYREAYLRHNSLGAFCPRFAQLSESKRIQAWVWFWAALGHEESGCDLNKFHGTHYRNRQGQVVRLNPREGHGLWALERSATVRRGRGAACSDISSFDGQARCSVDIMARNQLFSGASASGAADSRKYWGPTRNSRQGRQIIPHMRRFTECF
jgi:hypothetical protein